MLICPECKTENPENAKFCLNCGIKLVIRSEIFICPNCGTENPPETRFCNECENDLKNQLSQKDTESVNKVNWRDSCPVCKSSKLNFRFHKGFLGITSKNTLECDDCGAVFEEDGQKYKLSKVKNSDDSVWRKYKHQSLTEAEWNRITNGGISDDEQREIDINEFLAKLQNGFIDIGTDDSCPIVLKKDEKPSIVMNNISLREPRSVRHTVGGYAGPTIRIAKGVSFKMGSVDARSESHEEIREIDIGSLVLTNKRLIFIGSRRTTNIDLKKIVAIEPYKDGIGLQRENKQKTEYFTGTDKCTISFTKEDRYTTIFIDGIVFRAAIKGNIAQL